jgi:hypothetical protein
MRSVDTGTYADDCLVNRVTVNKCYIVATVSLGTTAPFNALTVHVADDGEYGLP